MRLRAVILLCFSFVSYISISIKAQNTDTISNRKNHFLEIGFGINNHAIRDKGTSPLTYQGVLPFIHLQYFWSNNNFIGIIDENIHIGSIFSPKNTGRSKANSYNNSLSFTALFRATEFGKYKLFGGGELGTLANFRVNEKFSNADVNYDIFAFVAPSAMFEYNISWNRRKLGLGQVSVNKRHRSIKFQYALSVPFVTALLRPGYVTINDFVDDNSLIVEKKNIHFVSFDHLFFIKNRFTLYYILHNNNMIKFNYGFDYYSYYRDYNPLKGYNSTFMISVVFRFNNNN